MEIPHVSNIRQLIELTKNSGSGRLLLFCYFPTCPSCKRFHPLFQKHVLQYLAEQTATASRVSFAQVNVHDPQSVEVATVCNVHSFPALIKCNTNMDGRLCIRRQFFPAQMAQYNGFKQFVNDFAQEECKLEQCDQLSKPFPDKSGVVTSPPPVTTPATAPVAPSGVVVEEKDAILHSETQPATEYMGLDYIIGTLMTVMLVIVFGIVIAEMWNICIPALVVSSSSSTTKIRPIGWSTGIGLYVLCTLLFKH